MPLGSTFKHAWLRTIIFGWLAALYASDSNSAYVTFVNHASVGMRFLWISNRGDGMLHEISQIQAGQSSATNSFVGHQFRIEVNGDPAVQHAVVTIKHTCVFNCEVRDDILRCREQGEADDLYEVLEVDEDADAGTIKKKYRQLSVKFHPDKNPDERERFNAIRDAYEILSDPEKRVLYDTGGLEILKEAKKGNVPSTEDISQNVDFTLADAYMGVGKTLHINRRVVCRGCRSNPGKKNCNLCQSCPPTVRSWHEFTGHMIMRRQEQVPSSEDCRTDRTAIDVQIEKGMHHADSVTFKHMASQMPGHSPGNVVFNLKQLPDKRFARSGNDLKLAIDITLREALLGWKRRIRHLDGHMLHLSTNSISKPGQVLRIQGEGMPVKDVPSQFGDLVIVITIVFPAQLTAVEREKLSDIVSLENVDGRGRNQFREEL